MPYKNRAARIFLRNVNHMQNTPERREALGTLWFVQFERVGVFKTPSMGWTFNNDMKSKGEMEFDT